MHDYGEFRFMIIRLAKISIFCAVLATLLGACAPLPTGNAPPPDAAALAAASDAEYVIGPGDNLQVFVWRNPDVTQSVPVRPDGKISTPLVEDMQAAGKTPSELARDIETVLGEYIKNPVVTVIVTGFVGSQAEKVRVVGQAARPQSLQYRQNMTLLDVMIEVGGLTQFAAGNRAKLIRRVGGELREIPVRADLLIEKGDMSANVPVYPGDVLIIPETRF